MKNICASTLLFTIVMSSFSFLFLPRVAKANLNDNFEVPTIEISSIGETTATIKYTLKVGGNNGNIGHDIYKNQKTVATPGAIADGTEELGDASDGGIEDRVGNVFVKGADGNSKYEIISGNSNDNTGPFTDPENGGALGSFDELECNGYGCGVYLDIAAITASNFDSLDNKEAPRMSQEEVLAGTEASLRAGRLIPGETFDPEIGFSFVIIPDVFKSEQTVIVTITGLTADTQYYASGRLMEGGGGDDLSASDDDEDKIVEFKTKPVGSGEVTGAAGQTTASATDVGGSDNGPACFKMAAGVVPYLSIPGCFAQLLYYVFYKPTASLAALAAMFLDWFMHFSIQSATYSESEFISQGWSLVRDISNIVFIFILLYIAIGTILRLPSVDAKKMIGTLVVVALLINFSLFFTKIVVDASNILANLMYSTISVGGGTGVGDEKTISGALVSQFNPQTIFSKSGINSEGDIGMYIIVTLIAVAMNVLLIIMFLKIGILFVGRVISLMVAMIFSPLAFISMIVPGMKSWKNVGWTNWSSELIKTAFLAPVFLFFLYLIVLFLDLKTLAISDTASAGANLLYVLLPFAIVYTLLMKAQKLAIDLSGEIGQQSMAVMSKVGGLAVGAATGGAALALRGTVGAAAARTAANPELQAAAAAGDKGAQRKLALANYGAASSFDFRKTKAGTAFGKQTGWDMDTKGSAKFAQNLGNMVGGAGKFDLSTEGGAKSANERKTKEKSDKVDTYLLKGYEASQQDKKAGAWKADLEKALEEERKNNPNLDEVQFRKDFEKGNTTTTYVDPTTGQTETIRGRAKEKTAKEVNSERLHDQANEVEFGNGYTEKRNVAKEQATQAGQRFDEAKWRKDNNIETRSDMSKSEKQFTVDTRKKAGEESKPISGKERQKAEGQITRAAYELKKIDQHLQDIADTWNADLANAGNPIQAKDVSFDHVEFAMNEGQSSLSIYEAQLKKAEKDVADGTITAQQYAQVKSQYDKTKGEIASYKTLFNDKAQQQNAKSEAEEKLSS